MHEVYCHTSPSGKRYVGWTSRTTQRRWREHVNDSRRRPVTAFHRAIRKYGPDAFTHEVLERMTTEAGAKRAEQLWIARLGTRTPGGYNLSDGGDGAPGMAAPKSPEHRAKLRAALLGRKNDWGHKIRAALKGRKASAGEIAALRARICTDETRSKLRAAATGRRHGPEALAKISAARRARNA